MFNPIKVVIDTFVEEIQQAYLQTYSNLEPSYPGIISFMGRMGLENIANSDASYHNVNHTIMVTMVGQEILKGKHLCEGGVSARDWLHFVISLLCHDIGYVRGVLREDEEGSYVSNEDGDMVTLPPGATDASLTPYHVNRGKIFVKERFSHNKIIDVDIILSNIEHTRFPVPDAEDSQEMTSYPGLLRAADLIGQLGDPDYMRKISSLFYEFEETGMNEKLGYQNAGDLRAAYPGFFWKVVSPYIEEGLHYLRVTQEGKQWITNLYAHIFAEEHNVPALGPERGD